MDFKKKWITRGEDKNENVKKGEEWPKAKKKKPFKMDLVSMPAVAKKGK